jgi:hypothetical protein
VFEAAASRILYCQAVVADLPSYLKGISPPDNAESTHSKRIPKTTLLSLTHRLHLVHPPFCPYALFSDVLPSGDWDVDSKPKDFCDMSELQRSRRHQRFVKRIVESAGAADSEEVRSAFSQLESVSIARWDNELWEPEPEGNIDFDLLKDKKDGIIRCIAAACNTWYSHTDVGAFTSNLNEFHDLPPPPTGLHLPTFVHHVEYRRRFPPLFLGTRNVVIYRPEGVESVSKTVSYLPEALSEAMVRWGTGIHGRGGDETQARGTMDRTVLEIYGLVGPGAIFNETGVTFIEATEEDQERLEPLREVFTKQVRAYIRWPSKVDMSKYYGALPVITFGKSQDVPPCGACGGC